MLQRGIETPNMDVKWVSSLSWYFLNLFGLSGALQITVGKESEFSEMQSLSIGAAPGQQLDFAKLSSNELEDLQLLKYSSALPKQIEQFKAFYKTNKN